MDFIIVKVFEGFLEKLHCNVSNLKKCRKNKLDIDYLKIIRQIDNSIEIFLSITSKDILNDFTFEIK